MNIAITGGGTGGHLAIAKVFKDEFIAQKDSVIFIGSKRGQDRAWFENDRDFQISYFLNSRGVVDRRGFAKITSLWFMLKSMFQAIKILKKDEIALVVSVGGFSAAPASFAAIVLGLPLYIHEQNALSGRLNRLLKPFAKIFFSSYEASSPVRDYPVREEFFRTARIRQNVKRVIFLGGSQGAKFINDFALEIAKSLHEKGFNITHQCGKGDFKRVKSAYSELNIEVELFAFSHEISTIISRADFAVSRAGASMLWELSANALPALFIPYPYAASDHQFYNADFLQKRGLAMLKREDELTSSILFEAINNEDFIKNCSYGLSNIVHEGGAKSVVEKIKAGAL